MINTDRAARIQSQASKPANFVGSVGTCRGASRVALLRRAARGARASQTDKPTAIMCDNGTLRSTHSLPACVRRSASDECGLLVPLASCRRDPQPEPRAERGTPRSANVATRRWSADQASDVPQRQNARAFYRSPRWPVEVIGRVKFASLPHVDAAGTWRAGAAKSWENEGG